MPKNTLAKLNILRTFMKASTLVVKAFDGSKRMVIKDVDLEIMEGPYTFMVTFQVMDINPSYRCFLGRPWIHAAGAITSTLHRRLKFIVGDKLIIVGGEEDMFINHLLSFRYIEADGETLKIHFQALEIAAISRRKYVSKKERSVSSWEKISYILKSGDTTGWGKVLDTEVKITWL